MVLRAGRRFVEEVRRATALRSYQLAEEAMLWDFREPGALAGWECISDRELGGRSRATLEHNKKGTGVLFHGSLNTDLPPAYKGVTKSGYCAIRSKPRKKLWFESSRIDVSEFDAFVLRLRGDGRRFIANIQSPSLARKDDLWQCFLYTRGGPEWEELTVSFGEFFLTHRGYMQDAIMSFPREKLSTFGLLLADRVDGPFELELQYIKAVRTLLPTPESSIP